MYKFYEKRYYYFIFSFILIALGIAAVFINGINLDISFKGGAIIKYTYEGEINTAEVEKIVKEKLNRNVNVQTTSELATKQKKLVLNLAGDSGVDSKLQGELNKNLQESFAKNNVKLSELNVVEPFIGKRFLQKGIISIILSSILIVLYVWVRFKKISGLSAGVMALVALFHDCLVVWFTFIVFKLPINESFVAVTLTIIGYSINDTIIIYDRIRENASFKENKDIVVLVNKSITQTMTRTINTTLTTIMSIIILLVLAWSYGIETIRIFALPMAIGMVSGCYSSVCIAGPLWVMWQKSKKRVRNAKQTV